MSRSLNQGISGDTIPGLKDRMEFVTNLNPRTVFIVVGINDLLGGRMPKELIPEFASVVRRLSENKSDVILHAVLPVNPSFDSRYKIESRQIDEMNRRFLGIWAVPVLGTLAMGAVSYRFYSL